MTHLQRGLSNWRLSLLSSAQTRTGSSSFDSETCDAGTVAPRHANDSERYGSHHIAIKCMIEIRYPHAFAVRRQSRRAQCCERRTACCNFSWRLTALLNIIALDAPAADPARKTQALDPNGDIDHLPLDSAGQGSAVLFAPRVKSYVVAEFNQHTVRRILKGARAATIRDVMQSLRQPDWRVRGACRRRCYCR